MKKIINELLPIFREIGFYSKNLRNIEKEFFEYQEPDLDNVESWLKEKRFEKEFIDKTRKTIDKIYEGTDLDNYQIFIGGQSHIDIAWRWRFWQTFRKAVVTYNKAVFHIKNHANYTYISSQPVLIEWIYHKDPDLFDKIKDAVKTGRFDLCGGLYVEPDCHIPSGEAIVRQRLYGQLFYLKHFSKISLVEWIPDSFGYANNLPQIFLKSGSKYFMTTKLTNNKDTRFPFINFLWESPDGSQVITYLNPGGHGALTQHNLIKKYRRILKNGTKLIADYTFDKPEDSELFSEEIPPIAAFIGKGDGGHGPTGQEVAIMDQMCEYKKAKWITATDYFVKVLEKYRDKLPIWKDELYYEFHQGTFTTQGLVKRMNRFFEWRLCALESLFTILSIYYKDLNIKPIKEKIQKIWKFTLLNQFHDVLPGSSIPEVYDDCYDIWDYCIQLMREIERECWIKIETPSTQKDDNQNELKAIIYNGTGVDIQKFPIEIEIDSEIEIDKLNQYNAIKLNYLNREKYQKFQILLEDNFPLDPLFLKRKNRIVFVVDDIKSHGFIEAQFVKNEKFSNASENLKIEEQENYIILENSYNKIKIDKSSGIISSIYNKIIQKEVLNNEGIKLNLFYDWVPDEQCWNLLNTYGMMPIPINSPKSIKIMDKGPVKISAEVELELVNEDSESKINGTSIIKEQISLFDDCPGIFVDIFADWHTCEAILKLDIHTTTNAEYTISESPYATIKRLTEPKAYHDKPRWENIQQSWLDLPAIDSNKDNWGLAVINNGKYGFDNKKGMVGISLVRGPFYPSPANESWIIEERKIRKQSNNPFGPEPPTHADIGSHLIQFIILPHKNNWFDSDPNIISYARAFNFGLISKLLKMSNVCSELSNLSNLIELQTKNIEISVLKLPEEQKNKEIILRINELINQKSNASIIFSERLMIKEIIETDLLERNIEELEKDLGFKLKNIGKIIKIYRTENNYINKIDFEVFPHEIKTFKLIL